MPWAQVSFNNKANFHKEEKVCINLFLFCNKIWIKEGYDLE